MNAGQLSDLSLNRNATLVLVHKQLEIEENFDGVSAWLKYTSAKKAQFR